MDWKTLDELIQDNYSLIGADRAEEVSKELLQALNDGTTKPLQAAKVAYVLTLLQLKQEIVDQTKALQFLSYLDTILTHEISTAESDSSSQATGHLVYVRKLSEHYFHHLMVVAEFHSAKKVLKKLQSLRLKNHDALLSLQKAGSGLWHREVQKINRLFRKHYVFAGLLVTCSVFFAWTSFWDLSDFAMMQWVYSEYSVDSVSGLAHEALLLLFSLSIIGGFVAYQSDTEME